MHLLASEKMTRCRENTYNLHVYHHTCDHALLFPMLFPTRLCIPRVVLNRIAWYSFPVYLYGRLRPRQDTTWWSTTLNHFQRCHTFLFTFTFFYARDRACVTVWQFLGCIKALSFSVNPLILLLNIYFDLCNYFIYEIFIYAIILFILLMIIS